MDLAERDLDAELAEDPQERLGVVPVLLVAVAGGRLRLLLEELDRRELVALVEGLGQHDLRLLRLLGLDDRERDLGGGLPRGRFPWRGRLGLGLRGRLGDGEAGPRQGASERVVRRPGHEDLL